MRLNAHASGCPEGMPGFDFAGLEAEQAFTIFADFAGPRPDIGASIAYPGPIRFPCTPWRTAARHLADRHNPFVAKVALYVAKK